MKLNNRQSDNAAHQWGYFFLFGCQVILDSSYEFEIVGLEMVYLKTSDYKVYVYKWTEEKTCHLYVSEFQHARLPLVKRVVKLNLFQNRTQ